VSRVALADWLGERYGITPVATGLVAKSDCEIYRVKRAGARSDLALRIYPARITERAAIDAEITWLAALGAAGLHVPTPQRDRAGGFIQEWPGGRLAVVLSWVDGRLLDAGIRPLHLRRVGRMTGAMHRIAEGLVAQGAITTRRMGDMPDLDAWADSRRPPNPTLAADAQRRIEAAARRLRSTLAAMPTTADSWGFIHSDLHLWNLLFRGSVAGAIDFSECGFGHHALDLAAALQYLKFPLAGCRDQSPLYPRFRDELLAGYTEERALPPAFEDQIDTCMQVRLINTVEWILDSWADIDERPWGRDYLQRTASFWPAD
jgi:Ser/Thr protein kinase RdoA (MazF antagonist)